MTFESVAGSKHGEAMVIVRSGDRVTLVFADAYMANPSKGLPLPLRLAGFGGGPRITPIFKLFYMKDKKALRAHFEKLVETPGLKHLVPCHGLIESNDAAGALKQALATL